jgi:hypothetical protein
MGTGFDDVKKTLTFEQRLAQEVGSMKSIGDSSSGVEGFV